MAEKDRIEEERRSMEETAFIAFARVYSGTLRPGKEVYVLGPKHDPVSGKERTTKAHLLVQIRMNN